MQNSNCGFFEYRLVVPRRGEGPRLENWRLDHALDLAWFVADYLCRDQNVATADASRQNIQRTTKYGECAAAGPGAGTLPTVK